MKFDKPLAFVPALTLMLLITYLSHQPRLPVDMPDVDYADKWIHCTAYFVLASFWRYGTLKNGFRHPLWSAFIIAVLFGAFDEVHQSFVPNRQADVWDWLADCLGALLACLLPKTRTIS